MKKIANAFESCESMRVWARAFIDPRVIAIIVERYNVNKLTQFYRKKGRCSTQCSNIAESMNQPALVEMPNCVKQSSVASFVNSLIRKQQVRTAIT